MKRSLLMLPILFFLAGCGRSYTLIGKIVFQDVAASYITELSGAPTSGIRNAVEGAKVTLFHELDNNNHPKRNSTWQTTIEADSTGNFTLRDYATPGEENLVGFEVTAPGYQSAYISYVDYFDPDEQYFIVVLRKSLTTQSRGPP